MTEIIALELNLGLGDTIRTYDQFVQAQAQVQRQIIDIRTANRDLNKELRDQAKIAAELRKRQAGGDQQAAKELDALVVRRKQLSEQLVQNQTRLRELSQEQRRLNQSYAEVDNARDAYQRLSAELRNVRARVKAVRAEGGIVSEADLQRVRELDKELKDIDASVGQFQRNVGNYGEAFSGLTSVLDVSAFTSVAGAAAAAGQILLEVGQFVFETTERFRELNGVIQDLTGATTQEVGEFSSRVAAIADTFGESQDEIINAANAVSKQLNISFGEALNGIEEGFIAGSNRSGEFLDSLEMYPAFFREAELPASALFEVINRTAEQGIYSDKGVDTIKEATLRIRENATATQAALEGIGLSSEELRVQIEQDGIGAAIATVSERLGELEATSPEVGRAIADIFGGPGEDAGLEFILSLKNINDETRSLIDLNNEYQVQQQRTLEINQEFARVQNEVAEAVGGTGVQLSDIGTIIQTELLRLVVVWIDNFKVLLDIFRPLGSALFELGKTLGIFSEQTDIAQTVTNFLRQAFVVVTTPLRFLVQQLARGVEVLNFFVSAGRGVLEWAGLVEKSAEGSGDSIQMLNEALDEATTTTEGVVSMNEDLAKSEEEVSKSVEKSGATIQSTVKKNREALQGQIGSIARTRQEIQKLSKQINETGDLEIRVKLTQRRDELQQQLDERENQVVQALDRQRGLLEAAPLLGFNSDPEELANDIRGQINTILELTDLANEARISKEQDTQDAIENLQEDADERAIARRAELFEQQLQAEMERQEAFRQITQDTGVALGETFGDFFSGQIETFKDFQREALLIALQALERVVEMSIIEAQIRSLANNPGPLGFIRAALIIGVIRGLFAGARALINRFEAGGVLEGPSHAGGGVQLFGKDGTYYGEAEGKEAIINKKASTNRRALGVLSHINEAFGGRRLGGQRMPKALAEELMRYVNASRGRPISYKIPTRPLFQTGGILQRGRAEFAGININEIDYDRLGEAVARSISNVTIVTDVNQFGIEQRNFNTLVQNAREL